MRLRVALVSISIFGCAGSPVTLSQTTTASVGRVRVTPHFTNVDIRTVLDSCAAITKKRVVVDPTVKVSVTLIGESLTVAEYEAAVVDLIRVSGLLMEEKDGVIRVAPIQPALLKQL
jgi:type II secretory pathway component GspD/PulD (secretin)